MPCFILSMACFPANSIYGTDKKDGITIDIVELSNSTGYDRSGSIVASINGHTLSVVFTENIGPVSIEIKDEGFATLDITGIATPSGYMYYIPLAGRYTVFFKLSNGDEYSGDFEVSD